MNYIKLSHYAKNNSISYQTAYNHSKRGWIDNVKILKTGTILIGIEEDILKDENKKKVVIYCRVSSNTMKENLQRQSSRLEEYAINNGYQIVKIVKEIASGMNDNRPKLSNILQNDDYDILLVEHKDRLTRFGFNYIETILNTKNINIEVVNVARNDDENLMEDLISIMYSFSARMYGQRKGKNKIQKIVEEVEKLK